MEKYINSKFIQKWNFAIFRPLQPIQHGPAVRVELNIPIATTYDITPYIQFEGWPRIALEWINRVRFSNWPSRSLIREIVESDFGAVPVSYKENCKMAEYEWRISFSNAESLLFQNMDNNQVLIYSVCKNLIDLSNIDKELLKTYYIKTVFFWFLEKVLSIQICRENLGVLLINFIEEILLSLSERNNSALFYVICQSY
jgi:hypothetical protein